MANLCQSVSMTHIWIFTIEGFAFGNIVSVTTSFSFEALARITKTCLRENLSATTPANGEKKAGGRKRVSISPTASLLPVYSSNSEYNAISVNQSPARLTTEPNHNAR